MKLSKQLTIFVIHTGLFLNVTITQEIMDENKAINEIYISTYALSGSGFGLQYKTSMADNQLLRVGLVGINSSYTKYKPAMNFAFDQKEFDINVGFEVGPEWRLPLAERCVIYVGPSIIMQYGYNREVIEDPSLSDDMQKLNTHVIAPGLGGCAGILIHLKDNFYFAADLNPAFVFSYKVADTYTGIDKEKDKTYTTYFDIDNETARISLVYRWSK